jgi:pimeloyl-ACP methyl ester carboxylesterase
VVHPVLKSVTIGQGKPLVLLHAFPFSHQMWQSIQPPPGIRFIFPDFPGFGLSPLPPEGPIDFTLLSHSLEGHLIDLGLAEPLALGGISMGGYWALEFARLFPNRINQLLFISTRPGVDKPEARSNRLRMADKVEKEGMAEVVDGMVPGLLGQTTIKNQASTVESVGHWIKEAPAKAVALAQRVMADRHDQTLLLPTLKVKTHVWAGQEDALIPNAESQAMSLAIPNSELKIFTGVGHLIPVEAAQAFQNAINLI